MQTRQSENNRQRGTTDLYIRGPKRMAIEPRRVVVEFEPDEYMLLEAACRGRRVTVPELVKVVALRLARTL